MQVVSKLSLAIVALAATASTRHIAKYGRRFDFAKSAQETDRSNSTPAASLVAPCLFVPAESASGFTTTTVDVTLSTTVTADIVSTASTAKSSINTGTPSVTFTEIGEFSSTSSLSAVDTTATPAEDATTSVIEETTTTIADEAPSTTTEEHVASTIGAATGTTDATPYVEETMATPFAEATTTTPEDTSTVSADETSTTASDGTFTTPIRAMPPAGGTTITTTPLSVIITTTNITIMVHTIAAEMQNTAIPNIIIIITTTIIIPPITITNTPTIIIITIILIHQQVLPTAMAPVAPYQRSSHQQAASLERGPAPSTALPLPPVFQPALAVQQPLALRLQEVAAPVPPVPPLQVLVALSYRYRYQLRCHIQHSYKLQYRRPVPFQYHHIFRFF
ncbi:hypothetical protein VTK73DRAFT_9728 [Phialemonium thermophilum]|uniref:Uncharacterized protein n=1 Tax=Phialemonium thermophilum TaxID=223376 RepID=A0ABR3XK05_9PEZI